MSEDLVADGFTLHGQERRFEHITTSYRAYLYQAAWLVGQLRANRTTSAAPSAVTLDDLYAERCREFAWETWHRNDMVRFGKYEGKWGFKTDADVNRRISPIPTSAFTVHPALTQNPGY